MFRAVIVVAGKRRLWAQETDPYRCTRRAANQIAPG